MYALFVSLYHSLGYWCSIVHFSLGVKLSEAKEAPRLKPGAFLRHPESTSSPRDICKGLCSPLGSDILF